MARMPSGAVASMLENDATKKTIFFDDFTAVPFDASQVQNLSIASPAFVSEMSTICKIRRESARGKRVISVPATAQRRAMISDLEIHL